ncbi:MAG: c-type cytochrome [Bryobacteraceae bacterium]|nr:c-type cytochrome [Bryobacteraceae bacterium]
MVVWLALLLFQQQILDLPETERNPYTSAADVAQGKKLFGGRCAGCHGPNGDGGKGANLAVPQLANAGTDRALYRVIRYGIPETEMPGFLMSPREIWQVAAFVRGLGRIEAGPARGDAVRGAELARGKGGCLKCHAVGTEGGRMGPALSDVGAKRSPAHLRNKLLKPESELPDDFRLVQLTAKDGRKISGVRLNEDTWSIQVRDFSDKFHSFWKQDLVETKVEKRTPMPSYQGLMTGEELDNVVAYLTSLRGNR